MEGGIKDDIISTFSSHPPPPLPYLPQNLLQFGPQALPRWWVGLQLPQGQGRQGRTSAGAARAGQGRTSAGADPPLPRSLWPMMVTPLPVTITIGIAATAANKKTLILCADANLVSNAVRQDD